MVPSLHSEVVAALMSVLDMNKMHAYLGEVILYAGEV